MPREVTMPQLGMAQNAGKLIAWLKEPGDEVKQGDMLFEVETDKATMEVEAQADGFLTSVRAQAGDEVPVGDVIAMISETADEPESAAGGSKETASSEDTGSAPKSDGPALPDGKAITMPQLGMAQDSGVLVAWAVSLGDEVGPDDTLFEVETDKSTMEVPAGAAGFLAATLANAGEAVPVGEAVAILSAEKPDAPVAKSRAEAEETATPSAEAPTAAPAEEKPANAAEKPAAKPTAKATSAEGRILASPKARRIALQEGLDLARLREEGHPEPYHVSDLDTLRALPARKETAATGGVAAAASRHLTAEAASDGLSEFIAWAAKAHELKDADAILAAFAGTSLKRDNAVTVAVERFGQSRLFTVPPAAVLSDVKPLEDDTDAMADLTLRDLRATRLSGLTMGAEDCPVLTITANGAGLTITLECAANHLDASEAIGLITEFAGRAEEPLRHLL